MNLKSSVENQGKTVTQIITNLNGIKKTFKGIKTETIEQGEFTHFQTTDGRLVLVNTKNVSWVEVFNENKEEINLYVGCSCPTMNCPHRVEYDK